VSKNLFIKKDTIVKSTQDKEIKKVAKVKKTESKKDVKKHIVRSGDTLWSIAKKYHISVKKLKELNNLHHKSLILDGMVLVVSEDIVKKEKRKVKKTKDIKVAKKSKKAKVKVALKKNKKHKYKHGSRDVSVNRVIKIAKRYLGTRYVWGAEGPRGFDCSGFTQYVMRKSKGVRIPRVSRRQAYYGKYVSRRNLKPGDLIFFDTSRRRRGYVNHVGIYIGNGKFIHASSARHRVVITSLNSPFYKARFKWGRRIN
jgi:cell wall-associated NlpC family hydrolase